MKGVLFKYTADPTNELLKDNRDFDVCKGFSDPDFWTNPFPVWSICGPYIRQSLSGSDVVFFLPSKASYLQAGYTDYLCSGVLVVDKVVSKDTFLTMAEVSDLYKRDYKKNLDAHINRSEEAPRTRRIRDKNIVIGDIEKSRWFGKNDLSLRNILIKLKIFKDLEVQRIKNLTSQECKDLLQYYQNKL